MNDNNKMNLILVDGSSFLYRAFHALPPLTNSKGNATGAIYGVINMLKRIIKEFQPEHLAVIFDPKGKTFRNDLYPEYKANRPPMPDDLRNQIAPLHEMIKAMGIPLVVIDNVEADDVIGTIAKQISAQNKDMIIATGDKDMAQLVDDSVTLVNTMTNQTLDREGVINKFGVPPESIIDYLTLIGDTVDNVPGVPKVGPKTAVKWLAEHKSLDNIIAAADSFTGKVGENLRNSLGYLPLSRQLVTIKLDVELPFHIDDLVQTEPNNERLIELFTELEFKAWLAMALGGQEQKTIQKKYETILTQQDLDKWLTKITKTKLFAVDTETTSLDAMQAELVGISIAVEANEAAYIPVAHNYIDVPKQLSREAVLQKIKPLLENPDIAKVGQNIKYDMSVLTKYDVTFRGTLYDTMLESYVLNSTASRHDMDSLALKYLSHSNISFEDIAGKGKNQLTFDQIDLIEAAPYAAEDADITLQLHQHFWPELQEQEGLKHIFNNIEMPLVPILSKMEQHGVLLNVKELQQQSEELAKRIAELSAEAYAVAGQEFNLNSPKQLQEILFEKCQLPILQKTPKGQPSTAEAVLQELAHDYPLPKIIIEHRSLSKLKSTYTDRLPEQIHEKTGRVHTSYHQAVTATGRLSSSDPNLQNIPVRTEQGRRIRHAFIAPPEFKLVSADYSQIELRIMAHLSEDKGLLDAFANDLDIHRATAAEVFSTNINAVTIDQRRSAKAINFGLIYGMSAFGLAKQLAIPRDAAQRYIDLYFARYPGVKRYMEETRAKAHQDEYVETLFGRRLNLPEINARNMLRQKAAERTAINAPMQGTAADIIKYAMIAVDKWLTTSDINATLIMQVHDELILEVHESCVAEAARILKEKMENATRLAIPLVVEVGIGDTWDAAH